MKLPLQTQRLTLRLYEPEDRDALLGYYSQAETARYLPEEPWTEEAADDLVVRDLVRVVPVGAARGEPPAVGVRPAGRHGVLGDAGDAVLRVRDVHPVPVQGDASLDVDVAQDHLDELARHRLHGGPR